ncbi:MAG: ATP-binding protein [Vicinamibacterales bacterium]
MTSWLRSFLQLGAAFLVVAGATVALHGVLHVSNAATVSITYLLIVLVVATVSRLWVAVATSMLAMFCFNFFFLPPVGTVTIADPQNWVALFAFLFVSLTASHLSAVARARTDEAVARGNELVRLFDLSRDVLMMTDSREALASLARAVGRRFDLDYVAIALPRGDEWDVFDVNPHIVALEPEDLTHAFAGAHATLEFDARARTYVGHQSVLIGKRTVLLVPLRVGTKPVGLMAVTGRPIEPGTLDALAGVVAIGIERAQLLEERRSAEVTRKSEELKSALLASLGHDLRTPLTAIRVAASNIKSTWLGEGERTEQADIISSEVERLSRLFENILDMARIDAGATAAEARWTHPSEIVAAARGQVEQALRGHPIETLQEPDLLLHLDPRLTATALAHLLENAAHYSPPGTPITLTLRYTDDALWIEVRDRGPGITASDHQHLFERFYRGSAAKGRPSGTGMGLAIARGLLALENGRVWAENCPDGGTRFTIVVPAPVRSPVTEEMS